jgi:hypothetical protein
MLARGGGAHPGSKQISSHKKTRLLRNKDEPIGIREPAAAGATFESLQLRHSFDFFKDSLI